MTIDPLVPLSFLEGVRVVDAPDGDLEAEYVPELRNKRFGLSDTVHAQIRRYGDAVRRQERQPYADIVALAKLIGRRPDAEAVFRSAGRHAARAAYKTLAAPTRQTIGMLPSIVSRPLALRQARRLARRYLSGTVTRVGASVLLEVPVSVTLEAAPRAGCAFYEAWLNEMLLLLNGARGAVEHTRCAARDEGSCEWRADWVSARRRAS